MGGKAIIAKAVNAKTLADAQELEEMIESEIGARYERPLGDKWNNLGLISGGGGSYDHKVVENVTNMQDAVIELAALRKYGDYAKVPFTNPREAAEELLKGRDYRELGDDVTVEFRESDPKTSETKRITIVFRDRGCGLTPAQTVNTILTFGSEHKDRLNWLQGAFGLGGETTLRNAQAAIVVTRRNPDLIDDKEEDRITVAVLLWQWGGKTRSIYHLVTTPWQYGQKTEPYSVDAEAYPSFEPGTQVTLISYGVEGFHRAREGDERSFDTVLNTRLYKPITPVRFTNAIQRGRRDYLRGLERRLLDNPRNDWRRGTEVLPYTLEGKTYHLPISYQVFCKRGEPGERRSFVAIGHAAAFTSNGQVHYHWDPQQFKYKTGLSKLYERIFVVVETDELPITIRSSFFTADRSQLVRSDPAIRLEEAVAGFLAEWGELKEVNSELIREALRGTGDSSETSRIARQISRALRIRGFSVNGSGESGGKGQRSGGDTKVIELRKDPTELYGPKNVRAVPDKTRFVTCVLNAEDDFIPGRGNLVVECNHPEIGSKEITVGQLRSGRIRVSMAVPLGASLGKFRLVLSLSDWLRSSGGVGQQLKWTSELEIVDEIPKYQPGAGGKNGKAGATEGGNVALVWTSHEKEEDWTKMTVGDVELIEARHLASERPGYEELANLGDIKIPTLLLNRHYARLKAYIGARARDLKTESLEMKYGQYAVGTGLGLLLLYKEGEKQQKGEKPIEPNWLRAAQDAVARGVLSMMPGFDALAREAGLED